MLLGGYVSGGYVSPMRQKGQYWDVEVISGAVSGVPQRLERR